MVGNLLLVNLSTPVASNVSVLARQSLDPRTVLHVLLAIRVLDFEQILPSYCAIQKAEQNECVDEVSAYFSKMDVVTTWIIT